MRTRKEDLFVLLPSFSNRRPTASRPGGIGDGCAYVIAIFLEGDKVGTPMKSYPREIKKDHFQMTSGGLHTESVPVRIEAAHFLRTA